MRYLIACPLIESESLGFINLRDENKHFAPKWKITLGPHITIMRPGSAICDIDEAIKIFQSYELGTEFTIRFKGFDVFKGKNTAAVFAEPSDYAPFINIRRTLSKAFPGLVDSESGEWEFHPHLTLINRLPIENLDLIMQKLESVNLSLSYSFDSVVLYKKETTDELWTEIARQELKK